MISSTWHAINKFSCAAILARKLSTSVPANSAKVTQFNRNQQTALSIISAVSKVFPPIYYYSFQGEWVVKTTVNSLIPLLTFLKRHTATQYRQLIDLTVIDHPKRKLRFEVIYQLLSITYSQRLSVSVSVTEGQAVDSATSVYSAAGWYERESWDRFGVFFRNHPDLRRRLTDYGFKGHPLRKDFPVTGFFEVRYNDFRKRILYEKVSLPQEYRIFTLENSWS